MPCERVPVPGGFAIVCTRGPRKRCVACNRRAETRLCDFPLTGAKAGKTCSRGLCYACAVKVGSLDYCPTHAKMRAKEASTP